MGFGVVLDTCVLYPMSLCDALLRLAERELFDPYWSDRILGELRRALRDGGLTEDQAEGRIRRMRRAFPAAEVSAPAIARLEAAMTNDPKDRHVLAAAVVSPADAIVTRNVRHFAHDACAPYDIEVVHPDRFLLQLHDLDPRTVEATIAAQAAALTRPPITRSELATMLERAGVPAFARRLQPAPATAPAPSRPGLP